MPAKTAKAAKNSVFHREKTIFHPCESPAKDSAKKTVDPTDPTNFSRCFGSTLAIERNLNFLYKKSSFFSSLAVLAGVQKKEPRPAYAS